MKNGAPVSRSQWMKLAICCWHWELNYANERTFEEIIDWLWKYAVLNSCFDVLTHMLTKVKWFIVMQSREFWWNHSTKRYWYVVTFESKCVNVFSLLLFDLMTEDSHINKQQQHHKKDQITKKTKSQKDKITKKTKSQWNVILNVANNVIFADRWQYY